jgi:hypothetical protein
LSTDPDVIRAIKMVAADTSQVLEDSGMKWHERYGAGQEQPVHRRE